MVERSWTNVDTGDATLRTMDEPTVFADDGRLLQLFENLIRNAVMHAGPGVTVSVGTLPDGFYVEDEGPGIPPDECEWVFECGYTTVDAGTGFGLRIVRTIADAAAGRFG